MNLSKGVRVLTAAALCGAVTYAGFYSERPVADTNSNRAAAEPTPARRKRTPTVAKYLDFAHSQKSHRLDCSTCHKFPSDNWKKVRPEKEAFPDITEYPKHESCLNCHRQQFFRGASPKICSICHTNLFPPRDSARRPFPNPREVFDTSIKGKTAVSDWSVAFPHDKHVEIVSANNGPSELFTDAVFVRPGSAAGEESCSVCHKTFNPQGESPDEYVTIPPAKLGDDYWLKKGTFKTMPIGHTTCFTCHSADSGMTPAPTDCSTCHKLKVPVPAADFDAKLAAAMGVGDKETLDTWARRESAGKFRHEWFSHAELSCSTCHNVNTIKTDDPATRRVSVSACATCHATATSDDGGALNFEMDSRKANPAFQCVKCHMVFGKLPVPDSHIKALADAAGKKS